MKPPFTSSQEMYNYAANQLINQKLSPDTVKNNLMERGVTDADAETCVQNMLVVIEERRKTEGGTKHVDTKTAEHAFSSSQEEQYTENTHGSFYDEQAMYNYAANQLIVQKLNQQTVKNNLMKKGVSDSQADTVIANMMVEIEKNRPAGTSTSTYAAASTSAIPSTSTGSFATSQEMYNYAADQLIVKKLSQQTVKNNLMNQGLSAIDADVVVKTMMAEIEKRKPGEVNAKRAEGKRMMLGGLVIGGIGAVLYGANFTVAGQSFVVSYGLLAAGAIFFFKGLVKMF
jgi:SOS response regulatory protein OraA/RecX